MEIYPSRTFLWPHGSRKPLRRAGDLGRAVLNAGRGIESVMNRSPFAHDVSRLVGSVSTLFASLGVEDRSPNLALENASLMTRD